MTRVLVFGDSHAGAYKAGWPTIAERHPDVSVDVFAVPLPHFKSLRLTRSLEFALPPPAATPEVVDLVERINGRRSARLAEADVVVWAGFRSGVDVILSLVADSDVDGLREVGNERVLSAAAFAEISQSLAERFVPSPAWRRWTDRRLVIAPQPLPAETISASDDAEHRVARRIAARPEGVTAAVAAYLDDYEAALSRHGIGLLRQPAETVGRHALTLARYSRGSPAIVSGKAHSRLDHAHMNAAYGALGLETLLASLGPRAGVAHRPVAEALAGSEHRAQEETR